MSRIAKSRSASRASRSASLTRATGPTTSVPKSRSMSSINIETRASSSTISTRHLGLLSVMIDPHEGYLASAFDSFAYAQGRRSISDCKPEKFSDSYLPSKGAWHLLWRNALKETLSLEEG